MMEKKSSNDDGKIEPLPVVGDLSETVDPVNDKRVLRKLDLV